METGRPLHLCDDVRAIDRAAIERDGIAAFELMTRAASAALDLLRETWPSARRIAVLCGRGNNGGDGYVLARLAREAGIAVGVFAEESPATTAEAARARDEWLAAGGRAQPLAEFRATPVADVVVDALFGIGLRRAPQGEAADAIDAVNAQARPVLALDVPSGLDADTGAAPGVVVRAAITICFIAAKRGLFTGRARETCGAIRIVDLGVSASTRGAVDAAARLLDPSHLRRWLQPRARDAHKGRHGHVLAVGGDHGFAGAIALCAEGALRAGAGYVGIATRAEHVAALVAARPEAMVRAVEDAGALDAAMARASVVALGPGLGRETWGRMLFDRALATDRARVLDADALNLLTEAPRVLPGAVLTPHPGEAARLLGIDVDAVERDRFAAVAMLAERFQACVVLKGAGSLVAAPGRATAVIDAGNPGMASGGMGDLLTGVIAALRAQGLEPFDAACAGALLHAAAGDAAACDGGERGMIARDLLPEIRRLANPP